MLYGVLTEGYWYFKEGESNHAGRWPDRHDGGIGRGAIGDLFLFLSHYSHTQLGMASPWSSIESNLNA